MQLIIHYLADLCGIAIVSIYQEKIPNVDSLVEIAPCQEEKFGHYQCNSSLKIAKILQLNPREVAEEIIEGIKKKIARDIFARIDIAGPGFINFTFNTEYLSDFLQKQLKDEKLGAEIHTPQKIVVDFSSPNIAKELHVGHLRSTIIGESICRLFEFLGNHLIRLNHIGDWGTQFGMLIAYLKGHEKEVLQGKKNADLNTLMVWYKAAKKLFDENSEFKKMAQLEVVKLQSHEKESIAAWQTICDISRKAFQQIYQLLDIKIVERGESFYNEFLPKIVSDIEKKGLIEISDGAKCVFLEGYKTKENTPLPVIVQKSDGGYNYDTTDLAGFWHRSQVEKADRIIIVTDAGQSLHFQMVHQVAVKANLTDPKKTRFDHVAFGVVLGPDGKKFKTRSGETVKLMDLLNTAIEKASVILKERLADVSSEEIHKLAIDLGIGAVKYADLSSHRTKDYVFSFDKMLRFEGNTAAFLFYSYVRILGIQRRVAGDVQELIQQSSIKLEHPAEISLGVHLARFGEILEIVADDLLPNRLTDYLYQLAEKFNGFFRDCRVEGSKEQNQRLVLCELTKKILKTGFDILGLHPLSRM